MYNKNACYAQHMMQFSLRSLFGGFNTMCYGMVNG